MQLICDGFLCSQMQGLSLFVLPIRPLKMFRYSQTFDVALPKMYQISNQSKQVGTSIHLEKYYG